MLAVTHQIFTLNNNDVKTTIFLLTILSVLALSSCKDEEHGIQVLDNADVENGTSLPDGWFPTNSRGKFATIWATDESFSPSKSLKISTPVADSVDFAYWAQSITENIPVGEPVTLRVKIKADLTGDGVAIAIRSDDTAPASGTGEQFVTTQGNTAISGSFDWKEFSLKLHKVDKDTKTLTVFLLYFTNTTGEVYFDDISLTY